MNQDCTRDPIYLLMYGVVRFYALLDGLKCDGDAIVLDDLDAINDFSPWIHKHLDEEDQKTSHGVKVQPGGRWSSRYLFSPQPAARHRWLPLHF